MAAASLVRIGLLIVSGLLLLMTNYWYVRNVWNVFQSSESSKVIAPFQIIGKDDAGGRVGQVLAHMLSARLGQIQRAMDSTAYAFDPARQTNTADRIRPQQLEAHPILVGYGGTERPVTNVNMSVGGVDLTGLLAWLQRVWTTDNSLLLSVCYDDSMAIVTGDLGGPHGSLWVKGSARNEELIEGVAYELAYRRFVEHVPQIKALTPVEFRVMLETLDKASQLNEYFISGRVPDKDQYVPILNDIEVITRKTIGWRVLVHVTAGLAENARNIDKALEWYTVEAGLVKTDKKLSKSYADSLAVRLATRIAALTQEQNAIRAAVAATRSTITTGRDPLLTASALSTEGRAAIEQIRKLLHVPSLSIPGNDSLRIAVLGGLPSDELIKPGKLDVLSSAKKDQISKEGSKSDMTDYITSVVQAVQIVAPNVKFVFSGTFPDRTYASATEIIAEIKLLASSKPNILLITLGPLQGDLVESTLKSIVEQGILVVIAAGNNGNKEPAPFSKRPVLKQLIVGAATDLVGTPATFSQKNELCLWAPGVQIPVSVDKKTVFQSGTAYSAALVAGVAARVLAEKKLPPTQLIDLLRSTSQPVNGTKESRIVNLEAALEKVKTL